MSCRHHLLLEIAESKGGRDVRPTSLRLNRPLGQSRKIGRRSGLASSAAHRVVQRWIDDAVKQLAGMRLACALDVAEQYPDGLTEASIGLVFGVSEQAINAELKGGQAKLKAGLRAAGLRGP